MKRTWAPGYMKILTHSTSTQLPIQGSSQVIKEEDQKNITLSSTELNSDQVSALMEPWLQWPKGHQCREGFQQVKRGASITSMVISGENGVLRNQYKNRSQPTVMPDFGKTGSGGKHFQRQLHQKWWCDSYFWSALTIALDLPEKFKWLTST